MGLDLRRAYSSLGMPPSRYLSRYALPLVVAGVVVTVALRLAVPFIFVGFTGPLLYAVPIYFLVLAVIYPYMVAEKKKHEIDNNIHFFITHMGVLATSNIPRSDLMDALGQKEEYGALAEEAAKIYSLVESWNMSLPEAARFISKRTPSEIFADFLDRFAYALESGEDLETFLSNEQNVVLTDYAAVYKGHLYEVENMKNLFNSMMMSVVFIVIFAILMPVITGIDAMALMFGAVFIVGFMEILFVYFTKAKAPNDPMWHNSKVDSRIKRIIRRTVPVSLLACVLVTVGLLKFTEWPVAIIIASGLTPLLYTGLQVGREEEALKRRDDSFAAFIRSLGASASARGGQVTEVMRHLQHHDFGPLTQNIRDLYARLNMRVDDARAWRYFSGDCGSNLIEKFSRMFIEGVQSGGKPDAIGRIISDNFVSIINLRKSRYQTAANFKGLLYGLAAGIAFALFVGVGIVGMLASIFQGMDLPEGTPFAEFFHFDADPSLTAFLVIVLLLGHALASSLMLKVADGGNYYRAYTDFVGMFWVAAVVSLVAEKAISRLL